MSPDTREWDATAYHRISDPQTDWGRRVLERLHLSGGETVIDAGCGTGRLTRVILDRVPKGHVIAVDQSVGMINAARENLLPEYAGRVTFLTTDLLGLELDGIADAIFSNATFHWILDHDALFRILFRALRPSGRLVAQCGAESNLDRLLERADRLVRSDEFWPYFDGWTGPWHFASPGLAASRLLEAGFVDVWTDMEYAPTMFEDATAYTDFVRTVVLRLHLERLPNEDQRSRFLAALSKQASADDPPFMLDYQRLNLEARRPAAHLGRS